MAQVQENYQLYKRYVKNISLVYQSRKDIRAYIELMLSISVIVIFGIFAIRPTFVTIAELQKEIEDKRQTLTQLEGKIDALNEAQAQFTENRRVLNLLETAVPDGPLPVLYARQIEGLTRRHNTELFGLGSERVVILGAKTASKKTESDVADRYPAEAASMEFNINVQGQFFDIRDFIADIEKLRRPMFIDNLSIRVDDDSASNLILSIIGRVPFVKTD